MGPTQNTQQSTADQSAGEPTLETQLCMDEPTPPPPSYIQATKVGIYSYLFIQITTSSCWLNDKKAGLMQTVPVNNNIVVFVQLLIIYRGGDSTMGVSPGVSFDHHQSR